MSDKASVRERYHLLDALRGLAIILMVFYHFGYDLCSGGYLPRAALYNPLLNFLQPLFAGIFILLSGASSRFSHSNALRGLKLAGIAVAISIVTWYYGSPIYFGIIHFLAASILIYAALRRLLDRIPSRTAAIIYAALFSAAYLLFSHDYMRTDSPYLFMFGFVKPPFHSVDYFPLLPWFFCFMLGACFGDFVKRKKLPRWFYRFKMPVLPAVGRHTLIIYVTHQAVLLGIIWLFDALGVPKLFL